MRSALKLAWLLPVAMLAVTGASSAPEPIPIVAIQGEVSKPARYSLEQLQKLPVTRGNAATSSLASAPSLDTKK